MSATALTYPVPPRTDPAAMITPIRSPTVLAALVLAGLLAWAPLPFASVTPGGLLVLRVGSLAALALAATAPGGLAAVRPVAVPVGALVGLALVGGLQAVAWPAGLAGAIAPAHRELAEQARALAAVDTGAAGVALSLVPEVTLSVALSLLAWAAALAAAAIVGRDRRLRHWLFAALLAAALFQLIYGFRNLAAGSNSVWGLEVGGAADRLRGTFVNSAHLALYLEMALAATFAAAWWGIRRARRSLGAPLERRIALGTAPVLAWLLLFVALAFTRSRAGLAAAVLATLAQGLLLAVHRRRWRLLPIGALAAAAGIALVAWIGLERGLGRLLGTSAHEVTTSARLEVWRGTLELWRRFPWTGAGLGGFEEAFPMVEPPALTSVAWQHAHNDWLELLATGGAISLGLAALAAAALLVRLHRVLFRAQRSATRAAALAVLGALVAVAAHELFDFGLTLPANALTLAVLAGAAAGATDESPRRLSAG